jgi:hypothetical protein
MNVYDSNDNDGYRIDVRYQCDNASCRIDGVEVCDLKALLDDQSNESCCCTETNDFVF